MKYNFFLTLHILISLRFFVKEKMQIKLNIFITKIIKLYDTDWSIVKRLFTVKKKLLQI